MTRRPRLWGRFGLNAACGPKSSVVQRMEVCRNLLSHGLPPYGLRLSILAHPMPPDAPFLSTPQTRGPMRSGGSTIASVPAITSGPGVLPSLCSGMASPITSRWMTPGHAGVEWSAVLRCLPHVARAMPSLSNETKDGSQLRMRESMMARSGEWAAQDYTEGTRWEHS
jgi:hypothetical protein